MLLKAERAVGWIGAGEYPTKTALSGAQRGRPKKSLPKRFPLQKQLLLFPDELEIWKERLQPYARQGFNGIIVANETSGQAYRQRRPSDGLFSKTRPKRNRKNTFSRFYGNAEAFRLVLSCVSFD